MGRKRGPHARCVLRRCGFRPLHGRRERRFGVLCAVAHMPRKVRIGVSDAGAGHRRLAAEVDAAPLERGPRIAVERVDGMMPSAHEPQAALTLNDMLSVCEAAIAGHGLVQLPTDIATPPLRAGRLAPVLSGLASTPAQVMLHYPARPLTPARVRVVVDFLYEQLHDHPDLTFDPRGIRSGALEAGAVRAA